MRGYLCVYAVVQLLFGGWDVPNLPTSLDAIEPYLLTLNATAHEPIPSWVSKMVEDIIEHGSSPVFEPAKTGLWRLIENLSPSMLTLDFLLFSTS